MDIPQVSQLPSCGRKPKHEDDDDDGESSNKRHQLCTTEETSPSRPLENHRLTIQASPSLSTAGYHDTQSSPISHSNDISNQQIVTPTAFTLFSKLPPELRLQIWRETWEHRDVIISRKIVGIYYWTTGKFELQTRHFNNRHARQMLADLVCLDWGLVRDNHNINRNLVTYSYSFTRPPISLSINWESRHETLRYFQVAFALAGGHSAIYFNFDLDTLLFPLHYPLSTALSMADLRRLVRISIPSMVPPVGAFTHWTAHWAEPSDEFLLPRLGVINGVVCYEEFKNVWILLRVWFPALREIRLSRFHECKRYESTRTYPMAPPLDFYCSCCFRIQHAIRDRFRGALYSNLHQEVACILRQHNMREPFFREETLVIGRVPSGSLSGEDEDVTVTFEAFRDAKENTYPPIQNDSRTRRQCVARTLIHALRPPMHRDSMVCII